MQMQNAETEDNIKEHENIIINNEFLREEKLLAGSVTELKTKSGMKISNRSFEGDDQI